jgi:hypothetical protein
MRTTLLLAALIALVPALAAADETVLQKVQTKYTDKYMPSKNTETEMVQTMYFKGKKLRIDTKDQKVYAILDFDKRCYYSVDPESQTYSKVPFADLKDWRAALYLPGQLYLDLFEKATPQEKAKAEFLFGDMIKQLRKDLANQDKETKVEVRQLDEEQEIAGHTCKHAMLVEEGLVVIDVWLTDKIETELNFAEWIGKLAPFSRSVKEKITTLEGVSLKTTYVIALFGRSYKNTAETVEVKTDELPAAKFEIPETYEEVPDKTPLFDPIRQYEQWKKTQEQKKADQEKAKPEEPGEEKSSEPEKEKDDSKKQDSE